ncbi:hypothetical protein EON65_15555 [archaeon]|nr:MAG: hypothetical protein EON65_15555 [archaeon]
MKLTQLTFTHSSAYDDIAIVHCDTSSESCGGSARRVQVLLQLPVRALIQGVDVDTSSKELYRVKKKKLGI